MFELMCLSHLIFNERYLRRTLPYIKDEYFADAAEREIFCIIKDYVNKYNSPPTKEAVAIILNEKQLNENVFERAFDVLSSVGEDKGNEDYEWLLDETEKWARDKAIYNALTECISIHSGDNPKKSVNAIPEILQEALAVCLDSQLGHEYFGDAEQHYQHIHSDVYKIPFDVDILNKATKGGIEPGTLNVVQAGINVGKTTFLIDQACHWLTMGKNVLYLTLEVAEDVIRHRADTNLLDMPFDALFSLDKHRYMNRVQSLKTRTNGRLYIKQYPSGLAHTGHFRHLITELKLKKEFKADLLIVDYLGEMASSLLPASAASNTNTYFTSVARELRSLGIELKIPVWTASQFTRTGQDSADVKMGDTADAIGIPKVADFMLALLQPDEMAERQMVIGKVLKNRYGDKSKLRRFMLGLDNDKQRLFDVDPEEYNECPMSEEEKEHINNTDRKGRYKGTSKVQDWYFG